jgi:hypothetical protein
MYFVITYTAEDGNPCISPELNAFSSLDGARGFMERQYQEAKSQTPEIILDTWFGDFSATIWYKGQANFTDWNIVELKNASIVSLVEYPTL